MRTGHSSCGSLASFAQDNQADSDRECPAGWQQGSACQDSSSCWGRQPRDNLKPCGQSLTCPQSLVKGIVVSGRRLQWLHFCTGSHDRLARGGGSIRGERRLTRAGRRRPTGGRHCLAIRRVSGGRVRTGSPAGQRRPTGGPRAAGSARQSRTASANRRQRTGRNLGTDRWTAQPP